MSIDIRRFSSLDPEFEAKILELQAPIEALDPALGRHRPNYYRSSEARW
jgi:hypothetical protein